MSATADRPHVTETRFEPAGVSYEPVLWPDSDARFGLILLDSDHAAEREMRLLLPPRYDDVFVTRVRHGGQCDLQHLAAMGDELARSASLLLPESKLDVIGYFCTSGTVAIGIDRVRNTIQSVRPGAAVTTPISAARDAFHALEVDRIAMMTPYIEEVNRLLVNHLASEGVEVTTLAAFGLHTDVQISSVPADAIVEAARRMSLDGADALFISCTGLRVAGVIGEIERALGIPVVTSNQAMAWEMLRLAGCKQPVPGMGRLLEQPVPLPAH